MTPQLRQLITDAIAIIEEKREMIYASYKDPQGVVTDEDARAELDKFDSWIERAREALA